MLSLEEAVPSSFLSKYYLVSFPIGFPDVEGAKPHVLFAGRRVIPKTPRPRCSEKLFCAPSSSVNRGFAAKPRMLAVGSGAHSYPLALTRPPDDYGPNREGSHCSWCLLSLTALHVMWSAVGILWRKGPKVRGSGPYPPRFHNPRSQA